MLVHDGPFLESLRARDRHEILPEHLEQRISHEKDVPREVQDDEVCQGQRHVPKDVPGVAESRERIPRRVDAADAAEGKESQGVRENEKKEKERRKEEYQREKEKRKAAAAGLDGPEAKRQRPESREGMDEGNVKSAMS